MFCMRFGTQLSQLKHEPHTNQLHTATQIISKHETTTTICRNILRASNTRQCYMSAQNWMIKKERENQCLYAVTRCFRFSTNLNCWPFSMRESFMAPTFMFNFSVYGHYIQCYGELGEHKLTWSVTVTMTQISKNHKTQCSKDGSFAKFLNRWPKWDVQMSHYYLLHSLLLLWIRLINKNWRIDTPLDFCYMRLIKGVRFLRLKYFYNLFYDKNGKQTDKSLFNIIFLWVLIRIELLDNMRYKWVKNSKWDGQSELER